MSRFTVLTVLGLVLVIGIAAGLKHAGKAADPAVSAPVPEPAPVIPGLAPAKAMSEAERAKAREFWAVYQQATEAKQAGQWERAVQGYRKALEIQPDHWDSLYNLGSAHMELREYAEAETALKRLAAVEHVAARGHSALGELYSNPNAGRLFNLRRAAQQYDLARGNNADESGSILRLGEVATAAGESAKAQDYLSAASRTNFKSVSAVFLQGYLAWEKHDSGRALTLFRKALDLTKVQKPPKGVLGEGDTKMAGYAAMVLPGQRGLFDSFVARLWRHPDPTAVAMNAAYADVRSFIAALPKER